MALRGWATFAWLSDYGQFYLVDREDSAFLPPQEITAEMQARSLYVPETGIVVYTNDCLQQHIRIAIHDCKPDHSPTETMSGKPWTRIETVKARFPSQRFGISSPSLPDPWPAGPVFLLDAEDVTARIGWMEFEGSRDDSVPVEPDVIDITLWPG